MRFFFIPLFLLTMSSFALAIGVDQDRLSNPIAEARAQNIMKQLRCLVCQNQSIVESDAELAADLRAIVREQVKANKTDPQIIAFMTNRYGDWILLKPPFKRTTLFLWLGPFALLLMGAFLVFRFVTARQKFPPPEPLSTQEKIRLKQIMKDDHQ